MSYEVHHGDCLEVMKSLPDNSVDAVVTDPPYGLSFMGKRWDYDVPSVEIWQEVLRVLKPGGHLLSFGGTRTYHRMVVNIEDAGFEIRDMIAWVYGSGFPKSLDVSKAIDKAAGYFTKRGCGETVDRNALDYGGATGKAKNGLTDQYGQNEPPATDAARQWQGWGTALKPALEPITVARKPLGGTVAENVLRYGTGGINVDGCRVIGRDAVPKFTHRSEASQNCYGDGRNGSNRTGEMDSTTGRWPANLIHDGSDEVVGLFPGSVKGGTWNRTAGARHFDNNGKATNYETSGTDNTTGSAARFFYCAKASKAERDAGLEGFEEKRSGGMVATLNGSMLTGSGNERTTTNRNNHPTVKPTELMRYLCRLITPPNGTVLDPFAGSGSTGKAAILEGFSFIGIEREEEYAEIARARIAHVSGGLFV